MPFLSKYDLGWAAYSREVTCRVDPEVKLLVCYQGFVERWHAYQNPSATTYWKRIVLRALVAQK